MNNLVRILLSFGLTAATALGAEEAPAYAAERSLAGTIRIWGPASMSALARNWAEGFRRGQPGVKVEINLMGSDTAIPGLYSGQADIAFLGRENNITDDNGFFRPMQYKPERFELTTGSLDVPGKTSALVVFVHRDNPLARLTLAQLDAIFGHERRRGAAGNIRTWGDLGLTGEWAGRPVNLYGYDAETGTGQYFLKAVLGDSRKMNWENLREFKDLRRPDGSVYPAAEQSLDALRLDRFGLAVSCLRFASPEVKAVALAAGPDGPYFQATRETLIARQYPLARTTYAFINRPPGNALEPKVREFLRYIFSREGQADLVGEGGYLPLNHDTLAAQRQRLQ
jgi:phosphate transport system substrate-binding protein